jgi:hypothetical protein
MIKKDYFGGIPEDPSGFRWFLDVLRQKMPLGLVGYALKIEVYSFSYRMRYRTLYFDVRVYWIGTLTWRHYAQVIVYVTLFW